MKHWVHFDETYSPVVSWSTICLFITLSTINAWYTVLIDFVMAYTQASIARPTYMELLPGVTFKDLNKISHCLKILSNRY
jgi:hypothetical protein